MRLIHVASRTVTTIAGLAGANGFVDGVGTVSRFNGLKGIAIRPDASSAIAVSVNASSYSTRTSCGVFEYCKHTEMNYISTGGLWQQRCEIS